MNVIVTNKSNNAKILEIMDLYEFQKANSKLFPQISMKDILFLHYACPQKEKIMRLYSKHMQFIFPISGERILNHGNRISVLNSKNGNLLKKCVYLQELPKRSYYGWHVLVFYLKDEYLLSIFEEFRPYLNTTNLPEVSKDLDENIFIDDKIRNSYEVIIPYFNQTQRIPESILEGKFKELLFNIFSHSENRHILSYIISIVDRHKTPIWEIMEANYMYDLKIQDFANISNRSTSTFKRDFKEYYKVSPGKWLTERRLNRAKSLLETTNSTINEVAFESGFKNSSHFSRIFKEKYHLSPSDFKKS